MLTQWSVVANDAEKVGGSRDQIELLQTKARADKESGAQTN